MSADADIADIAVLGAGPAGANAALAAAEAGARVVLVDEAPEPGGQVWRAKSTAIVSAPATPESRAGEALRDALARSPVILKRATRVWSIERRDGDFALHLVDETGIARVTAPRLILAPGAREFVQPLPGWTTPGVIGLAGATALMKCDQMAPGRAVVVCGTGPLVFFVAAEIRRLGGNVTAVVTPNSRVDWLAAMPALVSQPGLARRGARWLADLTLSGVPIHWRHTVTRIAGETRVLGVEVRAVDAGWSPTGPSRTLDADAVCLGHGLVPNTEPARLAGIPLARDPVAGTWCPEAHADGTTAIPGLFVCGDGAGIRGALAARLHGEIVGRTATVACGKGEVARGKGGGVSATLTARLARARRFGEAMAALSRPRPGHADLTTADTLVCRCEGITRGAIEAEIATGAESVNAVKSGLRAGMGPCGGKLCGEAVATILARLAGIDPSEVPPATVRPPLAPVPVSALAGTFRYDDLPIRKPAPL